MKELELELFTIWNTILGRKEGIYNVQDNFFELGGNSLQVIKLSSIIYEKYNINIDIKFFFDNPTINGLTKVIYNKLTNQLTDRLIDDSLVYFTDFLKDRKTLFFIHDGTGNLNGYFNLIQNFGSYNCVGIQFNYDNIFPKPISVNDIAKEYLEKIYKIAMAETYFILGWSTGAKIALEIIAQLELNGDEAIGFLFDYPENRDIENTFLTSTELAYIKEKLSKYDAATFPESSLSAMNVAEIWNELRLFLIDNPPVLNQISTENKGEINSNNLDFFLSQLNLVRMLNKAQWVYSPRKKILSQIYHFIPNETFYDNRSLIGLIEEKIAVEGDHFTMIESNIELISKVIIKNI